MAAVSPSGVDAIGDGRPKNKKILLWKSLTRGLDGLHGGVQGIVVKGGLYDYPIFVDYHTIDAII